jgi:transcriptional regulator with XRE-family HTH domain
MTTATRNHVRPDGSTLGRSRETHPLRLRAFRLGVTVAALARACGVNRGWMSRVLHGHDESPDLLERAEAHLDAIERGRAAETTEVA